jgi:GT2 family glycosyltransferase
MATASPLISIVTPTYKRPRLLERAVASARAQTLGDWELILSDDEDPPGETWELVQRLAAEDVRIRPIRNPGPHGQSDNVNFAMRHARGGWIKPLYDDDTLLPECLEAFARALRGRGNVVLAASFIESFRDNRSVKTPRLGRRAGLELIVRRDARLAMYLQDVDVGIPTQVMVRRDAVVERGVWFERLPGVSTAVDSWWYFRLLAHGDLLMINRVLAHEHQGAHVTVTSQTSDEAHDREVDLLRQHMWPAVSAETPAAPGLTPMRQALRLIRALHRLSRGQVIDAVRLASGAWHPRAWGLATRWALRRTCPGRFYAVPRVRLQA